MGEEIIIEPMREEDIKEVMQIERASFLSPWSEGAFLYELKRNAGISYSSVARTGKKVVGYVCFWILFDEAHLMNLAVHPDFRNMGIGRKLIQFAIDIARQRDVSRIILEVRGSNAIAKHLYEKFGFKTVSIRKKYYETPIEDALLMELKLNPVRKNGAF
ncbi:MAG: ribosomal protein S18-alanine N-acetyltransferase [Nitrospirota bacterium]